MRKLYKKILYSGLGVVAMGVSQNALADIQYIYLGVAPVYSRTNFQWQNSNTDGDTNSSSNTQLGAFIGYGVVIDRVYIGAEGAAQFGNRTAASQTQELVTQAPLTNTILMNNIYIIDFRPGYVFNDRNSLLYGILGLNTASFNAQQENSDGALIQNSGSIRKNGIRLGLGYNLGLGRYFMARVEYAFTKFSNFQFTDTDGAQTQTWNLNPYSNEISVGLSVVFHV